MSENKDNITLDIIGGDSQSHNDHSGQSHKANGSKDHNNGQPPKKSSAKKKSGKKGLFDKFSPKGRYIAGFAIGILEALLTITVLVYLGVIDIIPVGYMILGAVLLLAIAAFVLFTQLQRRSKLQLVGMIVSCVMCVVLGVGILYIAKTDEMLNKITVDDDPEVITYNIAVLKDDPAPDLEYMKNYRFAICETTDLYVTDAVDAINAELGSEIKTVNYDSVAHQADALYKKQVPAIIYNDALTGTIEEGYKNWSEDVRIVKTIKVKMKKNSSSSTAANVTKDPFIVFISGNDQYGELQANGRSDVNMLVCVNPTTHQVLLISTPRDFYVQFPGITGSDRDKLTHSGIYGMDEQIATINNLYDCDIDYYVRVNFSSLIEIVDAIGGITIYNEFAFTSVDGYYFPAGELDIDGTYALHYARERHAFSDGDFARGRHQEEIIVAMMNKLFSSTGMARYTALTDALEDCAVTNMPKSDITAIIKMQLSDNPKWEIISAQAEGDSMIQPCYVVGNQLLYVTMPYAQSIENVKAGEKVTKLQLQDGDDWSYVIWPRDISGYSFIGEDEEEELVIDPTEEETSEEETGESETYEEETSEEETSEEETSEEETTEEETTPEAPPEEETTEGGGSGGEGGEG